jgi:hypothetical protein
VVGSAICGQGCRRASGVEAIKVHTRNGSAVALPNHCSSSTTAGEAEVHKQKGDSHIW